MNKLILYEIGLNMFQGFFFEKFVLSPSIVLEKLYITEMDKIKIITFVSLTQQCTIQTSASYQVSDIKIYDPSAMKSPSHKPIT